LGAKPSDAAGEIIAAHGRHFLVELEHQAKPVNCVTRARRTDCAVGDRAIVLMTGTDGGVIEHIEPRRNLLQRQRGQKTKLLAANVDAMALVVAPEPPFYEELLLRGLIAARAAGIDMWLIGTKSDLPSERRAQFDARMHSYGQLGIEIINARAKTDPTGTREALLRRLESKRTVLVGQSGMGKSTLINTLIPEAEAATQSISQAFTSGRHTTTVTRSFALTGMGGARLIDSPGLQEWGLDQLSLSQAMYAMPQFAELLGKCRFNDCLHLEEPDCAIRAAVLAGRIDPQRYRICRSIIADLARAKGQA
jgi:ribosome biogenesis GTPase / thiamine phosphate phosphatase